MGGYGMLRGRQNARLACTEVYSTNRGETLMHSVNQVATGEGRCACYIHPLLLLLLGLLATASLASGNDYFAFTKGLPWDTCVRPPEQWGFSMRDPMATIWVQSGSGQVSSIEWHAPDGGLYRSFPVSPLPGQQCF